MRILVTGSNGFIGQYLCARLKEEHELIGIGRNPESIVQGIKYLASNIELDNFASEVSETVDSCDVIIHLAAYIDKDDFNPKLIDVNCKGALNIVSLSKKLGAKKIIYLSSLPVIGKPKNIPITEEHETSPNSLYHATKLMGEHIFRLASNYNVEHVNLRIPSPIGVGMNQNTILPVILKNCLKDEPIVIHGNGLREQNYIDVRDVVEAISGALRKDVQGTFNIASDTVISNIELANLCVEMTKSKSEIVFNGKIDPEETDSWKTSILKAKNQFDFEPKYPLRRTISDLLDFWNHDSN